MELELDNQPKHLPELCCGVSEPLIARLLEHLPVDGSLVLSIGCGSGLLESLILQAAGMPLNLAGVEVPSCQVKYLPQERIMRVPNTRDLHPEAVSATTLLFIYPRVPELIASYVGACTAGAIEQVIWLGPCSDWPDSEGTLARAFTEVKIWRGEDAGLPSYELLAVARRPNAVSDK